MALQLVLTDAGLAALVNAARDGTNAVKVASIGFTATAFTPTGKLEAIPAQHRVLTTIAGGATSPTAIHVTVTDTSADSYEVRGFGLYLDDGVLLGSYSQPELIMEKAAASDLLLSADVMFTGVPVSSLTFANPSFFNPTATTEVEGVVELATRTEAIAGRDTQRAVTPEALKAAIDSRSGRVRFETSGIFVVPEGVTTIYVSACGGGGAGGGGSTSETKARSGQTPLATGGSGGGAGKSVQHLPLAVEPGASIPIIVGAGGTRGAMSSGPGLRGGTGGRGGDTSIGNLLQLPGGSGGWAGNIGYDSCDGPSGGLGYPSGDPAIPVTNAYPYGPGGRGASCPFGGGGAPGDGGTYASNHGRPGFGFGAGGGGGGGVSVRDARDAVLPGFAGGPGLPGVVFIEWC